jgi:hypothetical protein
MYENTSMLRILESEPGDRRNPGRKRSAAREVKTRKLRVGKTPARLNVS